MVSASDATLAASSDASGRGRSCQRARIAATIDADLRLAANV
jgi:hypothetical protein